MPDVCEFCGTPLRHGRSGNYGSCAVCPIKICSSCQTCGLCPTHFNALSPLGQDILKTTYNRNFRRATLIFFGMLAVALVLLFLDIPGVSPLFIIIPWFVASCVVILGFAVRDMAWVKSFWRQDTAQPVPIPERWHCEACGFENPTLAQTCGQCGRNKSAALRIA